MKALTAVSTLERNDDSASASSGVHPEALPEPHVWMPSVLLAAKQPRSARAQPVLRAYRRELPPGRELLGPRAGAPVVQAFSQLGSRFPPSREVFNVFPLQASSDL